MNRKVLLIVGMMAMLLVSRGYSQCNYSIKAETGYLQYQCNTIQVDPGPNWKGYNLNEDNGIDFTVINGFDFSNKFYTGIGLGYSNFEGINGISVFTDFECLPLKTRLTPLINVKLGYSHIWNQYSSGTGTILSELGIGLNYRLNEKFDIYVKSGFTITQQSLLIPVRLGIRF